MKLICIKKKTASLLKLSFLSGVKICCKLFLLYFGSISFVRKECLDTFVFWLFLSFYPWWYKFFSLWQFDDFLFCMYKLYHIFLHSSTSFNRNQSKTFRQNPCFFDIRRGNWQINKDCLIAGIHFRWYNVKNV